MSQRNADFIREIARQKATSIAAGEPVTDRLLAERAAQSEAPGYYIEFDYAYRAVCRFIAARRLGGAPARRLTSRREMLREIALRVCAILDRDPRCSIRQAVTSVMTSGRASSFFMSRRYALRLYYSLTETSRAGRRRGRRLFHGTRV